MKLISLNELKVVQEHFNIQFNKRHTKLFVSLSVLHLDFRGLMLFFNLNLTILNREKIITENKYKYKITKVISSNIVARRSTMKHLRPPNLNDCLIQIIQIRLLINKELKFKDLFGQTSPVYSPNQISDYATEKQVKYKKKLLY